MRVVLTTAFFLLWAALVAAQTPSLAIGDTVRVVADHDGANTTGYLLEVNGIASAIRAAAGVQANGLATLTLRMIAVGEASQAPSDAITVAVVIPPPPPTVLGPCLDYVNGSGVASPKEIDKPFTGYLTYTPNDPASFLAVDARLNKIEAWGIAARYIETTVQPDGRKRNHYVFTCDGVVPAGASAPPVTPPTTPPPTTGRQSIPPLASITAPDGAIWTLPTSVPHRNGIQVGGAGSELVLASGVVYVFGHDNLWYRWSGTTWVVFGATAP